MFRRTVPWLLVLAFAGCKEGPAPPSSVERKTSLYARIGGRSTLAKVVDDFVVRAALNRDVPDTVKRPFLEGDVTNHKRQLVELLGEVAGGPAPSADNDLKERYAGVKVDRFAFEAILADLTEAMKEQSVKERDRKELSDEVDKKWKGDS
jgi:hemoglobin